MSLGRVRKPNVETVAKEEAGAVRSKRDMAGEEVMVSGSAVKVDALPVRGRAYSQSPQGLQVKLSNCLLPPCSSLDMQPQSPTNLKSEEEAVADLSTANPVNGWLPSAPPAHPQTTTFTA
ncbi:hypothetical protein AOLI_G00142330 [Acnodon oligacanthus]